MGRHGRMVRWGGALCATLLVGMGGSAGCERPLDAEAAAALDGEAAPSQGSGSPLDEGRALPEPVPAGRQDLAAEGAGGEAEPTKGSGAGRPRIFLIVVDTLRRDSVRPFSGDPDATPFIAALAEEGISFNRAYSTSSWTVPAMYSMITGLYPREHGVTGGTVGGGGVVGQPALSARAETLAERLKGAGYATFGVCTNHHLHQRFGFAQGFDRFVGSGFLKLPFPALAVESLRAEIAAAGPAFVWIHFFDPHAPYRINEPWFSAHNESGFADWSALSMDAVSRVYRERNGLAPDEPIPIADIMDLHRRARILSLSHPGELMKVGALGGPEVGDRYLGFLKEAYGSEVARVDDSIRAIFETLEIGDEDLVVVVADHGEEFMDHGAVGHRWLRSLHEELVRVPLVVRLPHGRAGGTVVDTPVSIVDLVPTILDAAGLRTDGCSGRSLLPIIVDGDRREVALHGELTEPAADVRFRLVYPWKYVHDFSMDRGELFNLADDPAEARDLSPVHPARAAAMKDALLEWMEATGPRWGEVETVPLSSQEIERLRAMGYLM